MRNPNHLYEFYDKLRAIHMTQFPDMRFGQLMYNLWEFNGRKDPFFIEDDKALELLEKFASGEQP